tara:strand:- start:707 stop:1264 length:558 start_codon:yes stop_codon:yes gene_type:complete
MKTVENGNAVKLHYKGTFPDGEVFDDSRLRGETMRVLVGSGNLIRGFESALVGMTEGETKTINLTPEEAYGQPAPEAVVAVPRNAFPEDFQFSKGLSVQGRRPDSNQPIQAKVISFSDTEVVLDHNHPLAGKDINFEIELVEIEGYETKSFDNYTVKELRGFAKEKGIKGFSTMKKAELVESLSS